MYVKQLESDCMISLVNTTIINMVAMDLVIHTTPTNSEVVKEVVETD